MAAIDFPNAPANGDVFVAAGKTWVYNGTSWALRNVSVPDGTIATAQLADGAVTTVKIAAGAVTATKLDTAYAPIASPTLTGVPAAPTATAATNTTQLATTAFVKTEVANLVASSPASLDTLNELALALGSDASFSTTVTNSLSLKAPLDGPTFTGVPVAPTAAVGTNTTQLATTAFVIASGPSDTVLDGGTPTTLQFFVMGAVDAGILA